MNAIHTQGSFELLCPHNHEGLFLHPELVHTLLTHPALVHRRTPAQGHVFTHAKRQLSVELREWLRHGSPGGEQHGRRGEWGGDWGVRPVSRRAPSRAEGPPIYRADGARRPAQQAPAAARNQEQHVMEDVYWMTPFRHRHTRWAPAFWTPYRRVADVYARQHSLSIWKANVRPGEPYWELWDRSCWVAAQELVDIFKRFVVRVAGANRRRQPTFEPTTREDLETWSAQQRFRTGWLGDIMVAILCILRLATDKETIPNVIIFAGDWELNEQEQIPSGSPEIVILHPTAITDLETLT